MGGDKGRYMKKGVKRRVGGRWGRAGIVCKICCVQFNDDLSKSRSFLLCYLILASL